MSGQLFIGGVPYSASTRDLEDIFRSYGKMRRCDIKKGYAFVEFDDYRDAMDAIDSENGTMLNGHRLVVEWAKGSYGYEDQERGRKSRDIRYKERGGRYDRRDRGYRERSPIDGYSRDRDYRKNYSMDYSPRRDYKYDGSPKRERTRRRHSSEYSRD